MELQNRFRDSLGQVKAIDISNNKLEGPIPDGVSNLTDLVFLNLSQNRLNGSITPKISQLTSLQFLDLSNNQLGGEIPTSLSKVSSLEILDLSNNNLSGRIPLGTQLQGFEPSSYMGNPGLCADPLPKCSGDQPPSNIPKENNTTHADENEDDDDHAGIFPGLYGQDMEEKVANEGGDGLIVAVGLTGGRKSKYILRWAMDKFLPEGNGNVTFKLLHVYPKITAVPTPMGNWLPIAQVREDVAAGYRQEVEWKKKKNLLPYQQNLKAQKVKSEIVMLESDDIAMAVSLEVERLSIRHLVIGISSTSLFSSGLLTDPTTVSKSSTFSAQQMHLEFKPIHKSESAELRHHTYTDTKVDENAANTSFTSQGSSSSESWLSEQTSPGGTFVGTPPTSSFVSTPPTGSFASTPPSSSFAGTPPSVSFLGTPTGGSYVGTPPSGSFVGTPRIRSFAGNPATGSFVGSPTQWQQPGGSATGASLTQISQLEKLRMELKHIEQMYELAQNSDINEKFLLPLDQLDDLSKLTMEEAIKLKREKAKELESLEKSKHKTAQNGASAIGRHAPENKAESKAAREVEENKAKQLLPHPIISQYRKFTWDEIVAATSSFSEEFKIGMGAFGTVYKCKLHHTTMAVKVLHSKHSATNKQFLQELEILSSIRHPNLLLLLGAVPEESSLVYEYMENGSLDDRLFRKGNTPPLLWYERFRICWEVATALAFLHSTKPNPIIHRDLKPANILLDQNLVSKIGDAGLGTMINVEPTSVYLKTIYKETSPVGTLCYIDPEYQRTGRVSTKSDIYALGVVILQLLTAKPAVGIAYMVEDALDEGNLMEVLDLEAGQWPEKETLELALLGLQCAELRGKDRPDLRDKVLPALERLKEVADSAKGSASRGPTAMPAHFVCPILKDVMEDPYVAADGYTYERRAIEQWLTDNDTSPTTNLSLPHKFIMPNYTLLEAIKQWKAKIPTK
ncbi:hypothetical protein Cgig2_007876 [Carnegiea gigantea]|uniref:RING-type E3 ubiquitin transferase n=1 Tax=Carnegiea gigantea TaxID=171969 RepID=A0A9Q1KFT0_9CARY|nr:hypothetical protein Cgig2_007876 [Carnegiea gigantea]